MPLIDKYLQELLEQHGSDLHLIASHKPTMRIYGDLVQMEDMPELTGEEIEKMGFEIFSVEIKEKLPAEKNMDFAYEMVVPGGENRRFRGNTYYQKQGLNIILRAIPNGMPTLESLGLPASLKKLTHFHQGLILATGPSGCGKTSTLAALVELINVTKSVHIITVEDPIEYIFQSKKALINQRQVGLHVESFQMALKGALREDPDVIFIGELRDLETIQLAITAAETGHLVMGTMHTNNAPRTIDRIIDSFPVDQQAQIRTMLSESLKGIISQKLIKKKEGKGRLPAVEILIGTISVANIIRDGKTFQLMSVIQTGKKEGMTLMDTSIMKLFRNGLISAEEAAVHAQDPSLFKKKTQSEITTG
ncbi:MAG: PilT/PilU family type 4a pilus ATPase [Candidatus Eremiobacteraeota bacterium]|nr:PilT/PilU family type 4a pilus ATPase [Candidatus Eremiobacteraeota bacterium]